MTFTLPEVVHFRHTKVTPKMRPLKNVPVPSTIGTTGRDSEPHPDLGKPVEEYMQDLREKLGEAAQYAAEDAGKQQAGYVGRYNLRARHKTFHEGDQVIVFAPESGGKLPYKWQGPGTVVKVLSQNSYPVDLGTNGIRHILLLKVPCRR